MTLLERERQLGGRVAGWTETTADGTRLPMSRGFHAFFRQYYNLRALLRRADPGLSRLVPGRRLPAGRRAAAAATASAACRAPRRGTRSPSRCAAPPSGSATCWRSTPPRPRRSPRYRCPAPTGSSTTSTRRRSCAGSTSRPPPGTWRSTCSPAASSPSPPGCRRPSSRRCSTSTSSGRARAWCSTCPTRASTRRCGIRCAGYLAGLGADIRTRRRGGQRGTARCPGGFRVHQRSGGTLDADGVVLAADVAGLRRLVESSPGLADPDWRAQVAGLRNAPPFLVRRLWLDRAVEPERPAFLAVGGRPPLDNVTVLDRYDRPGPGLGGALRRVGDRAARLRGRGPGRERAGAGPAARPVPGDQAGGGRGRLGAVAGGLPAVRPGGLRPAAAGAHPVRRPGRWPATASASTCRWR